MDTKQITRTVAVAVAAAILCLVSDCLGSAQRQEPPEVQFKDEPGARALYEKMVETVHQAETLSYESSLTEEFGGDKQQPWTYRVWMKKPNLFRVETKDQDGKNHGILVGDGPELGAGRGEAQRLRRGDLSHRRRRGQQGQRSSSLSRAAW